MKDFNWVGAGAEAEAAGPGDSITLKRSPSRCSGLSRGQSSLESVYIWICRAYLTSFFVAASGIWRKWLALRTRSSYRMGSAIVYHHLQTKRQRAPCFWSSLLPTRRSITQRISTGSASSGIVCSWQPESAGRYVVLGQKQGYIGMRPHSLMSAGPSSIQDSNQYALRRIKGAGNPWVVQGAPGDRLAPYPYITFGLRGGLAG